MKNFIFVLVVLLILGVLFFFFKPKSASFTPTDNSTSSAAPSASASAQLSTKRFDLVVKDKKLVSGPETLAVTQGERVEIGVTADIDDEFHLHGYDVSIDLAKNKTGILSLVADKSGRFEYELEKSKLEFGALEVQPK